MKRLVLLLMSCVLMLPLQACGWDSHEDVSAQADYWGGYEQGRIYTLHMDLFLHSGDRAPYLVPTGSVNLESRRFDTPQSIEAYKNGQGARGGFLQFVSSSGIIGVVDKDTRVRVTDVERTDGWNLLFGSASVTSVYGEILDGEFAGQRVDLTAVSDLANGGRVNGAFVHAPYCSIFKEACSWYKPE